MDHNYAATTMKPMVPPPMQATVVITPGDGPPSLLLEDCIPPESLHPGPIRVLTSLVEDRTYAATTMKPMVPPPMQATVVITPGDGPPSLLLEDCIPPESLHPGPIRVLTSLVEDRTCELGPYCPDPVLGYIRGPSRQELPRTMDNNYAATTMKPMVPPPMQATVVITPGDGPPSLLLEDCIPPESLHPGPIRVLTSLVEDRTCELGPYYPDPVLGYIRGPSRQELPRTMDHNYAATTMKPMVPPPMQATVVITPGDGPPSLLLEDCIPPESLHPGPIRVLTSLVEDRTCELGPYCPDPVLGYIRGPSRQELPRTMDHNYAATTMKPMVPPPMQATVVITPGDGPPSLLLEDCIPPESLHPGPIRVLTSLVEDRTCELGPYCPDPILGYIRGPSRQELPRTMDHNYAATTMKPMVPPPMQATVVITPGDGPPSLLLEDCIPPESLHPGPIRVLTSLVEDRTCELGPYCPDPVLGYIRGPSRQELPRTMDNNYAATTMKPMVPPPMQATVVITPGDGPPSLLLEDCIPPESLHPGPIRVLTSLVEDRTCELGPYYPDPVLGYIRGPSRQELPRTMDHNYAATTMNPMVPPPMHHLSLYTLDLLEC
ncbi:hypothetical protein CAPTEDRAFT_185143 [Capitella teleta]|uniref:Uncharacterized protein n=1 Tax=Capitella teleta TaxID=283909 RepID=R7THX1_CAPTE|nr:hypothetical protein CAPTEDRAFT_185143 [Capitella teleta]|eukprot:ELT93082.1 hypothetical protein CAPTEDRAFT_185143 [Capitella teleta]